MHGGMNSNTTAFARLFFVVSWQQQQQQRLYHQHELLEY
jgi:hypothetical protein